MNVLVRTGAITPLNAPSVFGSWFTARSPDGAALRCDRRPRSSKVSHHTRPEVPESRRTSYSFNMKVV